MTFANEMKDFINGYTAVRETGLKKRGLDIDEKKVDADIEYNNARLEIQREELELSKKRYQDGLARADAAARRSAERAQDEAARSLASSGAASGGWDYAPAPEFSTGTSDLSMGIPVTEEEKTRPSGALSFGQPMGGGGGGGYAQGGLVRKMGYANGGKVLPAPRGAIADELYQQGIIGPRYLDPEETPEEPAKPVEREVYVPGQGTRTVTEPTREDIQRRTAEARAKTEAEWRGVIDPVKEKLKGAHALPEGVEPPREAVPAEEPPKPTPKPAEAAPETKAEPNPADKYPVRQSDEKLSFGSRPSQVVFNRASEGMRLVLDGQEQQARAGRTAIGPGSEIAVDLATGEGGYSPEELNTLYEKIDPEGLIPQHMRTMTLLADTYTYFRDKGDMQNAYIMATKILAGEKQLSQTLGMLAAEAMKSGNTTEAIRLFGDAFDRFPTDHKIQIQPAADGVMHYAISQNGEVVDQGRLSGAEFMEMAGQVANGSMFMQGLFQFVAANKPQSKGSMPKAAIPVIQSASADFAAYQEALTALEEAQMVEDEAAITSARRRLESAAREYSASREAAIGAVIDSLPNDVTTEDVLKITKDVDSLIGSKVAAPSVGDDGGTGGDGTSQGNLPAPKTKAEFDALPSGTQFVAPDGKVRVKP